MIMKKIKLNETYLLVITERGLYMIMKNKTKFLLVNVNTIIIRKLIQLWLIHMKGN